MSAFWRRGKRTGPTPAKAATKPSEKPSAQGSPHKRRLVPLETKLLAMQALETGLSARHVAELAGVSQTTVDEWKRRYRDGGVEALSRRPRSGEARRLAEAVEQQIIAHRKEHPEHGVRRIRDELRRQEGVAVSAETVRRVVQDAGMGHPPPQPKRKPPQVRRFERSLPNALWQIDIFTFELKRLYRVYLVGIIDDHSRYIVGHGLFRRQTADAVLEVVRGAIGQWGAPREILSDNGRQFVAWRGKSQFQKVLRRQGIQHVRSAPHHPMTLGKIERFWKTIWDEFLADAVFASFADARQRLDHWMGYYNHQRPHQGIDGACPADRFYGVADDVEEALRQGCEENSLRIALGQETRPPLFLLGRLGETDVQVTRKGEDIEVRVGDAVHEVIRLGAPCHMEEDGRLGREDAADEVEGSERGGALPGGRDGAPGRGAAEGDLRELRGVAADAVPGDGCGRPCGETGAGAEASWSQAQAARGGEDPGDDEPDGDAAPGARGVQDALRGGVDLPGAGAHVRPWGAGRYRPGEPGGEKNLVQPSYAQAEKAPASPLGSDASGLSSWPWAMLDDGEEP